MRFETSEQARRFCEENGVPLGPISSSRGRALTSDESWARMVAMKATSLGELGDEALDAAGTAIEENEAIRTLAEGA